MIVGNLLYKASSPDSIKLFKANIIFFFTWYQSGEGYPSSLPSFFLPFLFLLFLIIMTEQQPSNGGKLDAANPYRR